jgi:hypothetical protein
MVKVVIDDNRLFMEHAQETLEMLEHKRWYTDAETQMRTQMLQHKRVHRCCNTKCEHRRCNTKEYTDAATQNANTDAATQVRTQMLAESQMLEHDCWNTNAETRLLEHEC